MRAIQTHKCNVISMQNFWMLNLVVRKVAGRLWKVNGSCMTTHTASFIASYAVAVYLNNPVQCNVHFFSSWVCSTVEYGGFSLWKHTQRRKSMKSVVGNLEYGFPVFQFLRNQAGLRVYGGLFKHAVYAQHMVIYVYYRHYVGIWKAVKLAMRLGSISNCTP
jgi:hypothetical protein